MKNLADYIDKNGMVCTLPNPPQDGGDSCSHGCAILYSAIRCGDVNTEAMLGTYTSKLEVNNGEYCRNPDPSMWYSRVNTFSRDQLTPLLALLGLRQQYPALRRLFWAHLKHLHEIK